MKAFALATCGLMFLWKKSPALHNINDPAPRDQAPRGNKSYDALFDV